MMVQLERGIASVSLVLYLVSLAPCFHCFSLFHPSSSSSRHHFTPQADSTSTSTSPSFPIPPTSYTCVVSINVPSAGYNLAYTEWSDGPTNVIRTDGRFQPTRITQVIKDGYVYRWDRRNTTEPCTKTKVQNVAPRSNSTSSLNHSCDATLSSSSGIYDCFRDLNPTYQGTSYEARGIYCDVWSANATITGPTLSFTLRLLFYFARDIPGIERVPVRAEFHANVTIDGMIRVMDQYWDWTAWTSGTQNPAIFNVPDQCTPSTTIPRLDIPIVSLVPPKAIQTTYVPPLPYEFSTVIETTSANIVNGERSYMVTSEAWHFSMPADIASRSERIDYKDTDGKDVIVVYAYQRADTTTPPPGKPPNLGAGTSYTVKDDTCVRGVIASEETSPLSTLRSGYTPTLFISPSLLAPPHYIYSGRQFARGVMCDTWLRIGNSWQRDSYLYTFNTTIYFFPENYEFPGRDLPKGFRMPMRVVNDGVMNDANDDTLTLYHDIWDFFLFNPGPQNYEWFNMTTQCPWVFVPDFDISATDAGATVAAIFGSLAGFACIVTVYNRWRRVRRMKRREHRKVLETLIFGGNKEEEEQKQEEMRLQQQQQMQQHQLMQQEQEQQEQEEQEQQQEMEDDDEYGQPQESEQPVQEDEEEQEETYEEAQEDESNDTAQRTSVR